MPQSNSCLTLTSGINQVPPDIYTTSLSSQLTYNINFPYLGEADVVVYREQPAGTFTLLTNSGTAGATPPNYTITGSNPSQVTFQTGEAPGGVSLIVGRRTDICKMLVEYQVGASIRAGDLNLDNTQLLYLIQELRSTLGEIINGDDSSPIIPGQDTFRISGGTGITVTEVGGPPRSQSINVDSVTIWGQNHDHSGNVSGDLSFVNNITFNTGSGRTIQTGSSDDDLTIAGATASTSGALIVNRDLELANAATTQLGGINYTWPSGQTANNVLTTDGSGNLTWGDGGSASGNLWELSGTDTRLKSATDDVLFRTGNLIKVQGTDNSSTVRTINIQAPSGDAGFTADWTLTLPDNAGNSGYVLQTNGSGVTNWVNPSSSTLWSRSGTTLKPTNAGDTLTITNSSDTAVSTFNPDGSADFKGTVKSSATTSTFSALNDGYVECQIPSSDDSDVFLRARRDSNNILFQVDGDGTTSIGGAPQGTLTPAKITLSGNGNAEFTGIVNTTNAGYFQATKDNGNVAYMGASDTELITLYEGASKNVILNANGSGSFNTGDAPVLDLYRASTSAGGGVFRLYSDVGATKRRSFSITCDGSTNIGGADNSGSPNIALKANGDGIFEGEIATNNTNGIGSDSSVAIKNSRVYSRNDSGTSTTNAFAVYKGGSEAANVVAAIKGDGSANFGGDSIGALADTGTQIYKDLGQVIVTTGDANGLSIYKSGINTAGIDLNANGSATFAGNIQATKPRSSTAGSTTGGLCINPSDTTIYYNFRVDSVDNDLRIDTSSGAERIKFSPSGGAEFAGDVDVNKINTTGTSTFGSDVQVAGEIRVGGTTNDPNTKLSANGSAEFSGNIDFTGLPTSDPGVAGRLWNDSGTLKISA